MRDRTKVIAVVGSYRKGGVVDTVIDEILYSAGENGAETEKIYLTDKNIKFCTNCRTCMQDKEVERGECIIEDDMRTVLDQINNADAFVLGSPVNFGTVTAVMKQFMERLACLGYWKWGMAYPKTRSKNRNKIAVLVVSSAAPSIMARFSSRIVKLLRDAASMLGARTLGGIFIGLAALKKEHAIRGRVRKKADLLGKKLACSGKNAGKVDRTFF